MGEIIKKYTMMINARWAMLSERDKQLAFWGGIVILFLLYVGLIWYPINYQIDYLKTKMVKDKKLITWMSSADDTITQLRRTAVKQRPIAQKSLLTTIDQEAKVSLWGSLITEIKQLDTQEVEVTFNSILFDDLIHGIEMLWDKNNVQVVKMNAQRLPTDNMVQATVDFK